MCLGPFEKPVQAPCKHIFCHDCIIRALNMSAPTTSGPCPLCRTPVSIYSLVEVESGDVLAQPACSTLWGSVFVQHGGLGFASYHFDSENDCYISYANAPHSWKLANGAKPPAKKEFSTFSWDAATRTFRGSIEWDPKFNGNFRWDYEIVFAEDFCSVVGGHVLHDGGPETTQFLPPWEVSNPRGGLTYLRWTPPPTTIYGGVYVQGSRYHSMLEGVASYHFDAEDNCYISYSNAPGEWRLDDQSPPPSRKPFTNCMYDPDSRKFSATIMWNPTFQGQACWKYEMTFAEDFSRIVNGVFRTSTADGAEQQTLPFSDPHSRFPDRRSMFYVRRPDALT